MLILQFLCRRLPHHFEQVLTGLGPPERTSALPAEARKKSTRFELARPSRHPWFTRRMSWHVSDETFRRAGETIFQSPRSPPEMSSVYQWPFKQRGSIMSASILNSIYREVLRPSMSGMHKFAAD